MTVKPRKSGRVDMKAMNFYGISIARYCSLSQELSGGTF